MADLPKVERETFHEPNLIPAGSTLLQYDSQPSGTFKVGSV